MLTSISYTAQVSYTGGRNGHVRSDDGVLDMSVSQPVALGGDGQHTNPEQLFAAAYAACFAGAVAAVARGRNVRDSSITARVHLGKDYSGSFGIAAEIEGHFPHINREEAIRLMSDADKICPYSKATRGNIEVKLHVV
jgi:Ohr subfamily peroxiredoxin